MSESKWASTESSVQAWSPDEVRAQKINFIPPEVIEAVNELLAKKWDGSSARFTSPQVKNLALVKMRDNQSPNVEKNFAEEGWLDFEPIFEARGWKIYYDRPAYDEVYDAFWVFSRKPS